MSFLSPAGRQKILNILPCLIIALGIVLRIAVYLQNRSLIIDEANIARNLFERNFATLAQPLSYEQYAPPIFLWIEKLATLLLGFNEYAMKLYPLLSGIAVLFLLYKVLQQYADKTAIWYALVLVATGPIYLRYSTEVKQYMPDAMVALALILFALQKDVLKMHPARFVIFWLVAGSITIWLSMPGVFMLAAIGVYYFYNIAIAKAWGKLTLLVIAGALWAIQFAVYYFAILQPQATSDYLQNFHHEYFLYPLPATSGEWLHNWELIVMKMLGNAGGHWALSIIFHLACIVAGAIYLVKKYTAKSILLIVPFILLLVAGAMHRYSFIPRLTLFCMPLAMVVMAVGLSRLFRISPLPLHIVYVVLCIICINNFNAVSVLYKPMRFEEMKQNLNYLNAKNIKGDALYVHHLAQPAFTYYTQIHPNRSRWAALADAHILHWGQDYKALAQSFPPRAALLYGWQEETETSTQVNTLLDNNEQLETRNDVPGGIVFIFTKKQ